MQKAIQENLLGLEVLVNRKSGMTEQPTHSDPSSGKKCPICAGRGVVIDYENKVATVCVCVKTRRTANLMRTGNISDEFVGKSFETFNIKNVDKRVVAAYKTALLYTNDLLSRIENGQGLKGAPWLGLLGMPGSGKTHLAHAVVKPLFELGVRVVFFNWVSSFTEWMAAYSTDNKARVDEIRQAIYNCDVLVMDDLCKESSNQTWIRETYGIIDFRYRKGLPVIYTSEYYAELIKLLSEATAGRLFEMSNRADPPALALMLLENSEDPLSLDYRLMSVLKRKNTRRV